jgi:predicted DCC family thiol-disulfide oxidoreductase YuxK
LRYDKRQQFSFVSLQSEYAKKHLLCINGLDIKFNTIVYQRNDNYLTKSDAVLKILNDIGGVWKIFLVFSVLPKSLRNFIYDLVANNRYSWFGKDDSCMIPNKEIKSRFLK